MATVIENKVWAGVRVVRARLKSIEQFPPGAICCPSLRAALIQYKDVVLKVDLSQTFFKEHSICEACNAPIPENTRLVQIVDGKESLENSDSIALDWLDLDEGNIEQEVPRV